LSVSVVKKLKEQFEIEMTYNSNAIEGNSLTLKETYLVINEGLTIKGKPLKDHLEAKNHQEALEYLYDLVEKDKKNTLQIIKPLYLLGSISALGTNFETSAKRFNACVASIG